MYSVVLMMAMSGTAAEAPAGLFHHGGGCTGYSGCTGSCNGWGGALAAPAGVTVALPADARLFAQGQPTRQAGAERRFRTPALEPGREFRYTLIAEVDRGGRAVRETRQVAVRAGERVRVVFPADLNGEGAQSAQR